jgi:hypothetical protein
MDDSSERLQKARVEVAGSKVLCWSKEKNRIMTLTMKDLIATIFSLRTLRLISSLSMDSETNLVGLSRGKVAPGV